MSVHSAFVMGMLVGLTLGTLMLLSYLMRFVQSDMDRFVKWLDKAGTE